MTIPQPPDPNMILSRDGIMADILAQAEPITQLPRLLMALDKYPSFVVALDSRNRELANARMLAALSAGDITQADFDLVHAIMYPVKEE